MDVDEDYTVKMMVRVKKSEERSKWEDMRANCHLLVLRWKKRSKYYHLYVEDGLIKALVISVTGYTYMTYILPQFVRKCIKKCTLLPLSNNNSRE